MVGRLDPDFVPDMRYWASRWKLCSSFFRGGNRSNALVTLRLTEGLFVKVIDYEELPGFAQGGGWIAGEPNI